MDEPVITDLGTARAVLTPIARWRAFIRELYRQDRVVWTDTEWMGGDSGLTPTRIRYRWTGPLGTQVSELTFEAWVSLPEGEIHAK